MTALLLAIALAAEPTPPTGVWLGIQGGPMADRVDERVPASMGLHLSVQPHPVFGVDLSGDLLTQPGPGPTLSRRLWFSHHVALAELPASLKAPLAMHAGLVARITPLRGELEVARRHVPLALFGLAGTGLALSYDDPYLADTDRIDARRQTLPALALGVGGALSWDRARLEVEGRHLRYRDAVGDEVLAMRPWLVSLRLAISPRLRPADAESRRGD